MSLSSEQRKKLQEALIQAFSDKFSLEQMLSFELNKNLDAIAGGSSLEEIVFNLIKKAEAENWVRQLIDAALRSNPNNSFLKAIRNKTNTYYIPEDYCQFFLNETQHANLKEELLKASRGLLSWERTLGNQQEIERPELEELLNRIETEDFSTTIVLGAPGCGKSALIAKLGHSVVDKGYALLAIKADFLGNQVNNLEDLQCDDQLNLSVNLREVIGAIANKEKLVLLVDQLDAISELLNRRSGRLNVLLNLIQSVAGTKDVHIIATCREFEFRHGSQFARLEGFEQLNLNLPTWEKISSILEQARYAALSIGEPLREMLRNPLHLKIFLEVAKPGEAFDSSQNLLDKLWEKQIIDEPDASKYIDFLEQIAQRMTREEILWLPTAVADSSLGIYQNLLKAGILIKNPDNSTFGFSHQTYYDHTLARAFSRGSQSLLDLVLERQDGLFVRPILLRGLNYLRGTDPKQYAKQLRSLLKYAEANNCPLKNKVTKLAFKILTYLPDKTRIWALSVLRSQQIIYIRTHIYNLLIEFVGSQHNPQAVEAELLIPLLNLETEAPKVLDAMIGSSGWFTRLRDCPQFRQWLEKPPEQAAYCHSFLLAALNFARDNVWGLMEEYWLNDPAYDSLSINVMRNTQQWTPTRVRMAQQVIQRLDLDWVYVSLIAEKIAEKLPELAPKIIRAHLDRKLHQAIESSNQPKPALPPEANTAEIYLHNSQHNPINAFKDLLETGNSQFYQIENFAKTTPKVFLEAIWSWFINVLNKVSYEANINTNSYREDELISWESDGEIIQALQISIVELANQDRADFVKFVNQNSTSDLQLVHCLVARGLKQIAPHEPQKVLDYLLGDSRRLCLGDTQDKHRETKKLITAVCPYLQPQERTCIEKVIRAYNYSQIKGELPADLRLQMLKYNRIHKVRLILAFPEKYLSTEAKQWRNEEIRAFPWVLNEKYDHHPRMAQIVGSPMNVEEMNRASDQHLLNLFDKLADIADTDYLIRQKDLSRAGGASSQAYEFGKLVRDDPQRFLRILPQLQPQRHESYAGNAIRELAENDFPASNLIKLVQKLEQRGFISEDFRSKAASALEKIAERNQGLPQPVISLLENWLSTHSKPDLVNYRSEEQHSHQLNSSIIFGSAGGSHFLPNGRGNLVRAIAAGYLKQNPPNLQNWSRVIQSRLGVEQHPAVWVDILTHMPVLLNDNRQKTTQLFDAVIRNCPEVLQYKWAFYFISSAVGWLEPKETVQGWLEMLWEDGSSFSHQVYGELLFMQYFQYQDEWSLSKIHHHLANQNNKAILCGLAHAASNMWVKRKCRAIAAKILYRLTSSNDKEIQTAVTNVFRFSKDYFELDSGMRQIINATCKNNVILVKAAEDIIEIIEDNNLVDTQPQIVSKVCLNLLKNVEAESKKPIKPLIFAAESLTTLAIQLHRQDKYREIGLKIFEKLLSLNLRETRSALEILDRRPNKSNSYFTPRRKLRRRKVNHSNN